MASPSDRFVNRWTRNQDPMPKSPSIARHSPRTMTVKFCTIEMRMTLTPTRFSTHGKNPRKKQKHTTNRQTSIPWPIPWNRLGLMDTPRGRSSVLAGKAGPKSYASSLIDHDFKQRCSLSKPNHGITAPSYTVLRRYRQSSHCHASDNPRSVVPLPARGLLTSAVHRPNAVITFSGLKATKPSLSV